MNPFEKKLNLKEKESVDFEMQAYNNQAVVNLMRKRGMLQEGETPKQALERAVDALLETEGKEENELRSQLLSLIDRKKIVFGTPIITNAGKENKPTSACVVIPVDLRADLKKIKESVTPYFESAMGSGFNLSQLDNPVQKLKDLNKITKQIEQNCERPVASMGMLSISHPQILEFIKCKRDDDFEEWRFNLSVSCTEEFMQAMEENSDWPLKDNDGKVVKTVKARDIFQEIADNAHYCGEPGVLFIDRFEADNPVPKIKYDSVAPCAEIAMAPGEVCQFSYVNLSEYVNNNKFDFETLIQAVKCLTRALDDSVEISIKNAVSNAEIIAGKRRIGIGVCGLADLFIKMGIKYDSQRAQEFKMVGFVKTVNLIKRERKFLKKY